MILLDAKSNTTNSFSPIKLAPSEKEATLSFGELLKGVSLKKDDKLIQNGELSKGVNLKEDDKLIQKGALVLSLEGETKEIKESPKSLKKETLLSLLKTENKESVKSELLELNPKLTETLSVKEMKTLIAGAKEYLKDKILQSDDYKNIQMKEYPKTLKGLSELAQKIGIEVSKITIEEVQVKAPIKEISKLELNGEMKTKATNAINDEVVKKSLIEENKPQVQSDVKELKSTPKEHLEVKEFKSKTTVKIDDKNQIIQTVEEKKIELPKQLALPKDTPLFKVQTQSEYTTEQLVATKAFKVEEKTPKTRADETLKLLLRSDKSSQVNSAMTADFSVATARVLAPSATNEVTKSLESLLGGGDSEDSSISSKTDGLTPLKADSFEVKLNEAKQMIKYLSQDVKTAIEEYKSPFTRVKVQLNPQKLGEVDLTVVQRGKNLHISLSSNSTAINTLSMNANELKTQLNNNGINNASLNFNTQDSSNSQAGQQEQNRQREQQARNEYSYFNDEEHNEEIVSSLEIVVPNYA